MNPETQNSLIVRLKDPSDEDAWNSFVEIYRPVILRIAQAKNLQRADAEDLTQRVLLSISKAIVRWKPDGRAKFRTWLRRIIDNAVINVLTRTKPDRAIGDDEIESLLHLQPDRNGPTTQLLKLEYRREVFYWAAKQVVNEFSKDTWRAFWATAIQGKSAEEVGRELGRNRGSIYTAKSRVMKRLAEKVLEFEIIEGE